ncbi:hypothetical protein ACJJI4_17000 [Microbulbifer sp. TRSA002]|uniref:hypothetical protein n=1 Tax=Microbulbifer sp. TRSA002 TaxID=3243382 RepID=UPI00403957EC
MEETLTLSPDSLQRQLKKQTASLTLSPDDLQRLLGKQATQLDSSTSLSFEFTPTSQTDPLRRDPTLSNLLQHEARMLEWLGESEGNARQFALDPISTFQRVCDPSPELVEELRGLFDREEPSDLIEEEIEEQQDLQEVESSPDPDLSQGWDLISASTQGAVNNWISELFEGDSGQWSFSGSVGKGPAKVRYEFAFDCPAFIAPEDQKATLDLPITGFIKFPGITSNIEDAQGQSPGHARLVLDLDKMQASASINHYGQVTVTIQKPNWDMMELDLSDIQLSKSIKGLDITDAMKGAVDQLISSFDWPIKYTVAQHTPLPAGNLDIGVMYTAFDGDSDSNLFGLGICRGNRQPIDALLPQTVPSNCTSALIVSNDIILTSVATAIAEATPLTSSQLTVTDTYPEKMYLNTDVEDVIEGAHIKIKENNLQAAFNNDGDLVISADIRVKRGAMTLWVYQTLKLSATISFNAYDDVLNIQVKTKAKLPFWWAFVPLGWVIQLIISILSSKKGSVDIAIPGFQVKKTNSPAYLQVGGDWAYMPIKLHSTPIAPPNIQMMHINQQLDENGGRFRFDFSRYGSEVTSFIVAATYWFFKYEGSTDHQTQTLGLSLTQVHNKNAVLTVTPDATLYGQKKGLSPSASQLTLSCIAVVDGPKDGVILPRTITGIPDESTSPYIPLDEPEAYAALGGWACEYHKDNDPSEPPKAHHVRTIELDATTAVPNNYEVGIQSTAQMHDDSGNNAIASIDGNLIELSKSPPLIAKYVTNLQKTSDDVYVEMGQPISDAAVFLSGYRVHYDSSDHDIRQVGGGSETYSTSGSQVILHNPHALIGDGDSGNSKHTQENSESHVSFLIIAVPE